MSGVFVEVHAINDIVSDYVSTIKKFQDKIYSAAKELNLIESYDFGFNDADVKLCSRFAECLNELAFDGLDEAIDRWRTLLKHVLQVPMDMPLRRSLTIVPKKAAALCLLNGKYYDAVSLMCDSLQLFSDDMNIWYCVLRWVLFLEDWDLLRLLLAKERSIIKTVSSEGYNLFIVCCELYLELHPKEKPKVGQLQEVATKIVQQLADVAKVERKTFLFSHCKALLRSALVYASRVEKANLNEICDPLYNRLVDVQICELIVQNRFPQLFKNDCSMASAFTNKFTTVDEFLKTSSSIADYFEAVHLFVGEYFDVGLTREPETYCLTLCKQTLFFCIPFRFLHALNTLFYIKALSSSDKIRHKYGNRLLALLKINLPLVDQLSQLSIEGSSHQQQFCTPKSRGARRVVESPVTVIPECYDPTIFKPHSAACLCGFCRLTVGQWNLALDLAWSHYVLSEFSNTAFVRFRDQCVTIRDASAAVERRQLFDQLRVWHSSTKWNYYENFLPPNFTNYWILAATTTLTYDETHPFDEVNKQKSYLTEAIQLTNYSLLHFRSANLLLLLLLRQLNTADGSDEMMTIAADETRRSAQLPKSTLRCYYDQKNFGHLFFREWRNRNCMLLANGMTCWYKALYFAEMGTPSIRQAFRTCFHSKREEQLRDGARHECLSSPTASEKQDDPRFVFSSSADFKAFIQQFPEDLTLINMVFDESTHTLWLVRFHALHAEPMIVSLVIKNYQMFVDRMRSILAESDHSVEQIVTDSRQFWSTRRALDSKVKQFVREWQDEWFGISAAFLLPLSVVLPVENDNSVRKVEAKLCSLQLSRDSAMTLIRLWDRLSEREWTVFARYLRKFDIDNSSNNNVGETVDESPQLEKSLVSVYKFLKNLTKLRKFRRGRNKYVLLVVPPKLSFMPWECLPIFERSPFVSRIPCIHLFDHLLGKAKNIPKSIDHRKSFYVLDPNNDLAKTRERLTAVLNRFDSWDGIVGKVPTRDEIKNALSSNDLFLYMGHGSGGRYFGRSFIRQANCNAVSVLMGCASDEGRSFDGNSSLYEYLIAKCPCVVGCLWMVTDGEIDRFFIALIEYCFGKSSKRRSGGGKKDLSNREADISSSSTMASPSTSKATTGISGSTSTFCVDSTYRLLLEGIVEARKSCKLPYLTGAAVVCYGLPVGITL